MTTRLPDEETIFCEALEYRSAEQRAAFLERICRGDRGLRERVEALLRLRHEHPEFLAEPAIVPPEPGADGRVADDADELLVNQSVGPYRILEKIGAGGFGAVYLAEQEQPLRRRVALKVIKLGMDTHQVVARFEAERQALAMMDHPNIARVLDAGATPSGRPFFSMELVRGVPITRYCDEARLTIGQRLDLFLDVCHAVQHAHTKGVIHRDLKPSNILVSRHDDHAVVKVIDFGIAKATGGRLTDKTLHTEFRQLIGTPAYMSPEQAGLSDLDIDTRSDVYSLGVLLYELLTGTTPFDAERLKSSGFDEMRRIIREEEPAKPSTRISQLAANPTAADDDSSLVNLAHRRRIEPSLLGRSLQGDLDWIVMKCLEKDRTRRYETANGLAMDIGRHLRNEPVLAGPPTAAYRLSKFARRNRGLVLGGSLVAAALVTGLVGTTSAMLWALRERDQVERARRAEREQRQLAEEHERQTGQIVHFQADMFGGLNPARLGRDLRGELLAAARAGLERRGADAETTTQKLAAFEEVLNELNTTNVAVRGLAANILVPAEAELRERFADQPGAQAALLQTIAITYRRLGLHAEAIGPQREALEIRRRVLGDDHPMTLMTMNNTVIILNDLRRFDEAESLAREALERCRRVLPDDHADRLRAVAHMGAVHLRRGEYAQAEACHREAFAGRRRTLGEDDPTTIESQEALAGALGYQDRREEAETLMRDALERRRRSAAGDGGFSIDSAMALAAALDARGELVEAEQLFREALAAARPALGDEHQTTVAILNNLGTVLIRQGRRRDAIPFLQEAFDVLQRTAGPDHSDTLIVAANIGNLLRGDERPDEAEPYLREVMIRLTRAQGEDSPDAVQAAGDYGSLLIQQQRFAEAEPVLRAVVAGAQRKLGNAHWVTNKHRSALGKALTELGRYAEAEEYLLAAEDYMRRAEGELPQWSRSWRQRLAQLYAAWDAAEPGAGHAEQRARWDGELASFEERHPELAPPATRPAPANRTEQEGKGDTR